MGILDDVVINAKSVAEAVGRKAGQIVDVSGAVYTVTGKTQTYYNGEEKPWSEVFSWVSAGSTVTLYLNSAGGGGGEDLPGAGTQAGAPHPLGALQAAGDGDGPADALDQLVLVQIEHRDPGVHRQDQLAPLPVLDHLP